jgi:hypothetical protein
VQGCFGMFCASPGSLPTGRRFRGPALGSNDGNAFLIHQAEPPFGVQLCMG